jgi:hypothetical protein
VKVYVTKLGICEEMTAHKMYNRDSLKNATSVVK